MAMRILSSRLMQQSNPGPNGLPLRVCSASMATSSAPAKASPRAPATKPVKREVKRESFKSYLATLFGGYMDPADPKEPPINIKDVRFPDVTDHATGEEKLFLLAFENGIIDPYCNLPIERKGDMGKTKDNPIEVPSFFDDRLIGCVCEPSQSYVKYTNIYKGEMKRCQCGYWLKCVDAPMFWQKIPKEDLLDITFFRDLEEIGALDEFMATGKLPPNNPKLGQV